MRIMKTASFLVILVIVYAILYYGRDLIIPMVIALFIWYLIKESRDLLMRIPKIGKKIPLSVLNILSFAVMFGVLSIIVTLISHNMQYLNNNVDKYQETLTGLISNIEEAYQVDIISRMTEFIGNWNFTELLSSIVGSISGIFSNAFTIVLYAVFLLLEESFFNVKLKSLFGDNNDYKSAQKIIAKVDRSISSYLSLKTLISLFTGFLSYIALVILGVDAPIFWSFLIFLLNYIPTIGSLIATTFPAIFALIQFGDFTDALAVLAVVGLIQLLVGNILEPRVMSNSLNISALVVLISLSFWGVLWGISGMFLAVPIMVVAIIILSEFDSTKPLAIILSEKGNIK